MFNEDFPILALCNYMNIKYVPYYIVERVLYMSGRWMWIVVDEIFVQMYILTSNRCRYLSAASESNL